MVSSKPKRLLPSEIGRLVYGYLGKVSCSKTQKVFLEENKVLKEIAFYVEKELIRSIDMEIEGQHLEDILNGYLTQRMLLISLALASGNIDSTNNTNTIKFEIDRLFDELQLKKPELYAFRSDGPLRKLKVLDGHWKSQPAHHKQLDRSQVVEIEAANSEAHRMLSKKTRSPASTTKKKSDSLQLPVKDSDICPSSSNSTPKEAEKPSHLKSRKNQLKSRVPTRGAGMSMPILSGFEIQDEVKKRIEAFTQKTDERIINSVVAEPLAHILAKTSEVDTAVENFLSNEDLLNNFTQVLDEVWATDCKKVNEKRVTMSTSGLLSTPQHQSSELIDSYVEQESYVSPSIIPNESYVSPSIIPNDTPGLVNGAQTSTSDERETIRSPPVPEMSDNHLNTANKNPSEHFELQGLTSHISRNENEDLPNTIPSSNNKESVKSSESTNLCKLSAESKTFSGQNILHQGLSSYAGMNDPLNSEVELEVPVAVSEVPLNSSQMFLGPLPKRQPRELPLLAEQEVHLVNSLPSQINDAENQQSISNLISSPRSTPHVIVVHQNQSSADNIENAAIGVSLDDPSSNLYVVMPQLVESLQPRVCVAPGSVSEQQAEGALKSVEASSEVKKIGVHNVRKTRSAERGKTAKTSLLMPQEQISNLQDSTKLRKSNRLAQKCSLSHETLRKPKASKSRKTPLNHTTTKEIHKSTSSITLVENAPWMTDSKEPKNQQPGSKTPSVDIGSSIQSFFGKTVSEDVVSLYHLDENARESLTLDQTAESSPSFRQIFQTNDVLLTSKVSPHLLSADNCKSDIEQIIVEDNKTEKLPQRQDSEGSQTLSSFSLPFSPPNLSISSTVFNEILKTSCGSINFSGLSGLFTESFDLTSNPLPEQKAANEDHNLENLNVDNCTSHPSTFKVQSLGINFSKSPKQSSTPRSSINPEASNPPYLPTAQHISSQLPNQASSKTCSPDSQTKSNGYQTKVTPLRKDFVSPSKRLPRKVPLVRVPITGVRIQPGQFCSQWEEQHNVNNLDNYTTRATKQHENLGSSTDTLESDKNSDDNSEILDLEDIDLHHNKRVKKRKRMASCERVGSEPDEIDRNGVHQKRKILSSAEDFERCGRDDPGFAKVPGARQNDRLSVTPEPTHFHMENQDHCSTHFSNSNLTFVNYQVYFEQEPYVEDLSNGD